MFNNKSAIALHPERDFKIKKGFTLAEVLITLGIIGIVASLTLPAIINSYKSIVLQSQLKSAYKIILDAFTKMTIDLGEIQTFGGQNDFYPIYKTYFNKIIDCGYSNPDENLCMSRANSHGGNSNSHNDLVYKTFNGNQIDTDNFDDGQFVLSNGMLVMLQSHGTTFISVDINGKPKGPSIRTRCFYISSNEHREAYANGSYRHNILHNKWYFLFKRQHFKFKWNCLHLQSFKWKRFF